MAMEGRKRNVVFEFADWWFRSVLKAEPDYKSARFRTMLGKAKNLQKEGYDLDQVRRAILTMMAHGTEVTTPYAVKFYSPDRDKTWYNYAELTMPPLWDSIGYTLWNTNSMPIRPS